jgi:hypothetical protein
MTVLSDDQRASIERILGRSFSDASGANVASLDQLPTPAIEELRLIVPESRILACQYLRFLVPASTLHEATAFLEEVVDSGKDPRVWRVGDAFFHAEPPRRELLSRSSPEAEATLAPIPGARWHRISPVAAPWTLPPVQGAPGVLLPNANHTSRPPRDVVRVFLPDKTLAEPVGDFALAYRRWLASRIAWLASERGLPRIDGISHAIALVGATGDRISVDATAALRGLLREYDAAVRVDMPPGFRGPDEWYI